MIIDDIVEEMHAKVLARVPMTLTLEQIKEVLDALDRPFVHPGVPVLSREVAVGESVAPSTAVASEAEPKAELKGSLPDDFPGRAALTDAGVNTYAQVRKQRDSKDGLTGVAGIGEATANKIEKALEG